MFHPFYLRITFNRYKRNKLSELDLADKVADYFIALITGAILLYVLAEIVLSLFQDLPFLLRYGIALIVAAAGALVVLAKRGMD